MNFLQTFIQKYDYITAYILPIFTIEKNELVSKFTCTISYIIKKAKTIKLS